jgi:hypothetical protein
MIGMANPLKFWRQTDLFGCRLAQFRLVTVKAFDANILNYCVGWGALLIAR